MTNGELHLILDDENRKLTKRELLNRIKLLQDESFEQHKQAVENWRIARYNENIEDIIDSVAKQKFYLGEYGAYDIALMLAEHLEDE